MNPAFSTYLLGLLFGLIVLGAVFLRMRNSGMKEGYATWWIIIALGSLFFSVVPGALKSLSTLLGVQVPLNLGFFTAGIILLLLSLRFSVDLSQASEDRRRLTEEIAILRAEVDELKARSAVETEDSQEETADGAA
ncbi:DUF2304 domain-containing protein [Actinomyces urogenitalis]|uniref:DUF2304 domain-containing protein n=1 Tax=Actinomyces urogenitalis TaxID=103621 RepID=UPI002430B0DA|nr:DUF2304 domain-containing protein [Actinomyces urogenitalis]MCI7456790.1 DUF2304 domain-containing protein [Actinomyces urogenitalis]